MKKYLTIIFLIFAYISANANIIDSGTCGAEGDGNNIKWELMDDSILTISGNGNMRNFVDANTPWGSHRNEIKIVKIKQGVASIGNYAFNNCTSLTSVTIPNSITSIEDYAFAGCRVLTSVYVNWNRPLAIPTGVFDGVDMNTCTLNVPQGTATLYYVAPVWIWFKNIVEFNSQESEYEKRVKQCDVNGDGKVNATDVMIIYNFILGNWALTDDEKEDSEDSIQVATVDVYVPVFEDQFDYISCVADIIVNDTAIATIPVEKGNYSSAPTIDNNPFEREVSIYNKDLLKDIKYCKVFTGTYKTGTTIEAITSYALTGKYSSYEKEEIKINMLMGSLVVATYGNVKTTGNTQCRIYLGIYTDKENLDGFYQVLKSEKPKSSIITIK